MAPAITFGLANLISPGVIAVLKQIGSAISSVGNDNPYALAVILGLVIPVTGMTPLSSMVLTSLLGLTGIPMAIGALTCTGASFVNAVLFSRLHIGKKTNAFAVFIEPLTQIDLIAKYPLQLYGTNAIIGVVNACIVTFSGLVINVKGMATPIAGAIVLFGFNNAVTSIITIITVGIVSVVLAFVMSSIIKKFNLMNISFKLPGKRIELRRCLIMAKSYDYQSAFDIIGPVMMGPSSSHTAGAVKIGNSARAVLGDMPKTLEIHYYESFAKTHQGHGTDVAVVGGAMGYSTFDSRIKSALDIAKDENIDVDIIEEDGESIGQHPNCAYIKANSESGRHIEVIGISIGGGTIKLKGINVNGLEVEINNGLPMLEIDGEMDKAQVNHLINDMTDMEIDFGDETVKTSDNNGLVVLPLNKAISESTLNKIREKYSDLNVSYIN